ncbi:MAG: bifunctional precorrin-2 dehydrogenase/sirohydrochlorin ferrochelatase [Deltaproteobacteria bacterium]|nr:bifunctional precorrin-2 dehydrogenase/sirohydrochlorin ferrochelatase [Deltaproteobacteria bacterium]
MSALYPVFLKLDGLPVVVVGAGPVADQKLDGLVTAGARITVIAPDITPAIAARAARGEVTIIAREFADGDLDGARWVVAAAPPAINRAVAAAAAARNLFVNAVDDPEPASAYLGGVIRRAGVTIAISTSGDAPALTGLIREALDALLPDSAELTRWFDVARAARAEWKARLVPMAERRPLLLRKLFHLYESRTTTLPAPTAAASLGATP